MKTNYRLRISVKNSKGNELVKTFNFTCEDPVIEGRFDWNVYITIKTAQRSAILRKLIKENYSMTLERGFKHSVKNPPISFEELCLTVSSFRFKEVIPERYDYVYTKYPINMGHYFDIIDSWNREYEGANFTFFELTDDCEFDDLGKALKQYGITLYKSKRYGLWFVVDKFKLSMSIKDWTLTFTKRSEDKVRYDKEIVEL